MPEETSRVSADLERAFVRLKQLSEMSDLEPPYRPGGRRFHRLADAVEALDADSGAGGLRASRRERALRAWEEALAGRGRLSRSDISALCWEPAIASSASFATHLQSIVPLRGMALRGLLASYHESWSAGDTSLESIILEGFQGLNRKRGALELWAKHLPEILGADAPRHFAKGCAQEEISVSERMRLFGLGPDSRFAREAARELVTALTKSGSPANRVAFVVEKALPQDNHLLAPDAWGLVYQQLVEWHFVNAGPEERQVVIDLALETRGLPDPRINSFSWPNVPDSTRRQVMRWLSEEDLRFFFDLIMEGQPDSQGRYPFWIDYTGMALRSRVVVGSDDEARLQTQLDELESRGRSYAKLRAGGGANRRVSAFIMDFGEVTIVEFSKANSACWIYPNDEEERYLNLGDSSYTWAQLKNSGRGSYKAHSAHWQGKFRQMLARYGVRPQ